MRLNFSDFSNPLMMICTDCSHRWHVGEFSRRQLRSSPTSLSFCTRGRILRLPDRTPKSMTGACKDCSTKGMHQGRVPVIR